MTKKEALEVLKRDGCGDCLCTFKSALVCPVENCEVRIALLIAIEVMEESERKKGQWRKDFDYDNSYYCTACGEIWILNDCTPEENNMNYCPNCGTDMRGEQE